MSPTINGLNPLLPHHIKYRTTDFHLLKQFNKLLKFKLEDYSFQKPPNKCYMAKKEPSRKRETTGNSFEI